MDELLLHRYLEGPLSDAERRAAEELLRSDPAARRRLDAMREEEHLISDALSTLSEPSRRLGDRVIASLHSEERSRIHILRMKAFRRKATAVLAFAACLVIGVFLVRPRPEVGTAISSTGATLITSAGQQRPLTMNMKIYAGDRI